jgi:hypothetical protein
MCKDKKYMGIAIGIGKAKVERPVGWWRMR